MDAIKAFSLLFNGLSFSTCYKITAHLIKEKLDLNNKSLRPMLQADLAFDVFKDCLKNSKPDYVTFFTNHVAGIMHRYWKYSFPNEFDGDVKGDKLYSFHKNSILKAMDIFDSHLSYLSKFSKQNDYDLIICSSMGQEAIDRGEYIPEIKIENFDKLKKIINYSSKVEMNMAMQPDVAFEFKSNKDLEEFKMKLLLITDIDNNPIFKLVYKPKKLTLNLQLIRSAHLVKNKQLLYKEKLYSINDFGFVTFERDIGTGYHQPYGILIWNNDFKIKQQDRLEIDTCDFAPTILNSFNIDIPEYMGTVIWNKK
mgnify:CR=1 FL=1